MDMEGRSLGMFSKQLEGENANRLKLYILEKHLRFLTNQISTSEGK